MRFIFKSLQVGLVSMLLYSCTAEYIEPQASSDKGVDSTIKGIAILDLYESRVDIKCSAAYVAPTVLLTSATCLDFKTAQGSLGRIQDVRTGRFIDIDTIWSLTQPTDPGDIGLVRLVNPPQVIDAYTIKNNLLAESVDTRFVGTQCNSTLRDASTVPVDTPVNTSGICVGGSGGVIFDRAHRQLLHLLSRSHTNAVRDEYTDLLYYADTIAQGIVDILGAPSTQPINRPDENNRGESPAARDSVETNDPCTLNGLYYNGQCDTHCLRPDPDCRPDRDVCQRANERPNGSCPPACESDPDCRLPTDADPCAQQGLYNNGRCDTCPTLDPDCADTSFDFCEQNYL